MEKTLIGIKKGMTQIYAEDGTVVPVTVIQAEPCVVLENKTKEKHGYSAIQLGAGTRKAKNVSKAVRGHCKAAGLEDAPPATIKEFRLQKDSEMNPGDKVDLSTFAEGEFVDVTGNTKGRGFQGVVKRHNFGGGRYSHGGGWKRKPGSIGQCEFPARVFKGKKLPGRMGAVQRVSQNLKIEKIDLEDNLICVKGAVPGPVGGTVLIRSAKKK
jgi:large subunit ribosomal protein L3